MIEVLQPADNKKLTTLQAVKEELQIDNAESDELLERLIDEASAYIVRYCRRPFALETYRETVAGYGGLYLVLSMRPIVDVISVKEDGNAIDDYEIESPDAGILYRRSGWSWSPALEWLITWHPSPNEYVKRYEVTYKAGYVLPPDPNRTLPEDIERACIDIVRTWFNDAKRIDAIQSESLGDYSVTYARTATTESDKILDRWIAAI